MQTHRQMANSACGVAFDMGRMREEFDGYSVAIDTALSGQEDAAAEIGRALIEGWRERWASGTPPGYLGALNGFFKKIYGGAVADLVPPVTRLEAAMFYGKAR